MSLLLTRGMMTFAVGMGEGWARVLLRALRDGTLVDMGEGQPLSLVESKVRTTVERREICGSRNRQAQLKMEG